MNGNFKVLAGVALATFVIIGGAIWLFSRQEEVAKSAPEDQIASRTGLHWHAQLAIYIKGEKQEVPEGIGLGAIEQPIHTHDNSGTIHMEFPGLVKKDDLRLGQFFQIWGKQFNSGKVKMMVNGQDNQEFRNYQMRDGDKIEIRYE